MSNATELNHMMNTYIKINSQESMLLKSIEPFYETLIYINEFISIINSESKISIRLIDYFVTKYAKKNKIAYKINNDIIFNVYQSYKQQLKAFQKKNFDPFARGIRLPYYIDNLWIITTIGQLNFFKWFITKNILDYVNKNKDNIELDMNKNKKIKINSETKIVRSNNIYKKQDIKFNVCNQSNNVFIKHKNNIRVTF
jgi:hypothetical protein